MRKGKLEIYEDAKGEWRWRLKSANGRIIATSGEGYTRKSDCIETQRKVAVTMREAVVEVAE
jgi:uncharacterized protein YegP (UPF0339 family)